MSVVKSDRGTAAQHGGVTVGAQAPSGPDGQTRSEIIRLLLSHGPSTTSTLAAALGLSATAVRRHLDALEDEELVATRAESLRKRRGRGRPPRVYLLTELGRERLPHAYDDLAVDVLDFLSSQGGEESVTAFARRRAERLVASVADELANASTKAEKMRILATGLTGSGYVASVEQVRNGAQLSRHHCPVSHVASKYPQLCEQELAVFSEVLDTHAQQLSTIARGDSFCTTFVAEPADQEADAADGAEGASIDIDVRIGTGRTSI